MQYTAPRPTADERAFSNAAIRVDTVADCIAAYGRVVSETGKLRERIVVTNNKLAAFGTTLDQLEGDPRFADAVKVQKAIRDSRQEAVRKLSGYAPNILSELKNVKEGIELVRALDTCTPFLSTQQHESLKSLEQTLAFVDQNHIFVRHGLTKWPRELSDARLRPALREYHEIVRLASVVSKNPPVAVVEVQQSRLPDLSNTIAADRGLRKQALIDTNLPESMRDDVRLKELSSKVLQQRLNTLLKLTDNSASELSQICERHPDIILDRVKFGRYVRRIYLLNQLAHDDPLDKRSTFDPMLAKNLRDRFLDRLLQGDDKDFTDIYKRVRECLQSDRTDRSKRFVVIDNEFMQRIFPKASHPLAGQELSAHSIINFIKKGEFLAWKDDPFTQVALRTLIISKISGPHSSAPREDWIKANFARNGKGLPTLAFKMLRDTLDDLISEGKIALTVPARNSKSGIQLVR